MSTHDHAHGHEHVHADGSRHRHSHANDHGAAAPAGEVVELEARILAKNDAMAETNRAWFNGPGDSGAQPRELARRRQDHAARAHASAISRTSFKLFVVEGDQATANDGERIRAAGAPAVQVNTGTGCHLEADMVRART